MSAYVWVSLGVCHGAFTRRSSSAARPSIGTPFCLTVDHQSLQDGTVTLRERDSLTQERLPIDGLAEELERRVNAPWHTPKLTQT
jgi:glycyl-tRNA synthetase (class II)